MNSSFAEKGEEAVRTKQGKRSTFALTAASVLVALYATYSTATAQSFYNIRAGQTASDGRELYLAVENSNFVHGGNVTIALEPNGDSRKWELLPLSDGSYNIRANSGLPAVGDLYLAVENSNFVHGGNVTIALEPIHAGRKWKLLPLSDGSYNIHAGQNAADGRQLHLAVANSNFVHGGNVNIALPANAPSRKWILSLVSGEAPEYTLPETVLELGNIYFATNESAKNYNRTEGKTFTIKHRGFGTLHWEMSSPDWLKADFITGDLKHDESREIKVWGEPPSPPSAVDGDHYLGNITITLTYTNDTAGGIVTGTQPATKTINVTATAYHAATINLVSPTKGENEKVNVAVKQSVSFKVGAVDPPYPGTTVTYQWRKDPPKGTGFNETTGPEKNYTFADPGDFTVFGKVVDSNGVESDLLPISVRAWNPPTLSDTPPQAAIDEGVVSWYDGKYVGVQGEPIRLQADAELNNSSDSTESIAEYLWDFDNNRNTVELYQPANEVETHIWVSPNLSGRIYCKARTNYGVESEEEFFDLKIYSSLEINPGGPYTGKPHQAVQLKGSIATTSYPGALIQYQWRIKLGDGTYRDVATDEDGEAEYAWTVDGEYDAEFSATVETKEGLALTDSEHTTVTVESGKPTAQPGDLTEVVSTGAVSHRFSLRGITQIFRNQKMLARLANGNGLLLPVPKAVPFSSMGWMITSMLAQTSTLRTRHLRLPLG